MSHPHMYHPHISCANISHDISCAHISCACISCAHIFHANISYTYPMLPYSMPTYSMPLSSSGYWGTTTLSGSRSWSRNSRSCCSRASNGRDLASTCVLRPRLEELVSLNFRGMELQSRRRIGLRSELRLSYNIQTGETTEVELRFIYADRTE